MDNGLVDTGHWTLATDHWSWEYHGSRVTIFVASFAFLIFGCECVCVNQTANNLDGLHCGVKWDAFHLHGQQLALPLDSKKKRTFVGWQTLRGGVAWTVFKCCFTVSWDHLLQLARITRQIDYAANLLDSFSFLVLDLLLVLDMETRFTVLDKLTACWPLLLLPAACCR